MRRHRPNIVLILIDDLGWRDPSSFGSTFHETPVIDRLAAEGIALTGAYASSPVCSPSRSSILTGLYPTRTGITNWIDSTGRFHPCAGTVVDAEYVTALTRSDETLAMRLRSAGYQTWHVGKWHLGGEGSLPCDHGFDVNVGGCEMGHPWNGYFAPWGIPTLPDGPDGEYLTDRLTDEAIALVRGAGDRPFFLNLWHYAVHVPIDAPAELVAKYRAKARASGLDEVEPFEPGPPHPCARHDHGTLDRRLVQSDPAYAAMLENLDANIGRLLAALEETGRADDTIVIFTSDNGGLSTGGNAPTSNLPLAAGKGWMYEGGLRVPLAVRWPGVIPAGRTTDVPVTGPDLHATILTVAGVDTSAAGAVRDVDGVSLVTLLEGTSVIDERPLFWHFPHYGGAGGDPFSAVRHGRHKLIDFLAEGRYELYDVVADPGEHRDLAATEPELCGRLAALLGEWQRRSGARRPRDVESG